MEMEEEEEEEETEEVDGKMYRGEKKVRMAKNQKESFEGGFLT